MSALAEALVAAQAELPCALGKYRYITLDKFGAAITYARRYAWQSVLGIAAEEDTDAKGDPLEDEVQF